MRSRIGTAFRAAILMAMAVLSAARLWAESDRPTAISDGPQLFLDNHILVESTNLARRLTQPTKHPANPLIIQDKPWEKRVIEIYGTVLYEKDKDKFRCWYLASEHNDGIPDTPEHPRTVEYYMCYAESEDGIHWTKPMVGEGMFGHHEKHNIVIPGGHGACILPTPWDEDPKRRYRALGGSMVAFSPDGIHWDMHPFKASGKNDTGSSVVHLDGEYLAFVRNQGRWDGGVLREVGLCVSTDFLNWTSKETVFKTDDRDGAPWTQPYGLAVTRYGDQLIGIVWMIHLDREERNNMRGTQDMQLIVSRDGRQWTRVADRAVFMAPTPETWDAGRIIPGTTMFVKDDRVHLYYTGTNTRHGSGSWGRPGIGLATLPADRFLALTPKNASSPGVLKTKLLSFEGDTLLINAGIPGNGLQVELLDAKGNVLPGFGYHHCRLVRSDPLRYRAQWESEGKTRQIGDSPDKTAAIRFHITQGELYAFQIIKEGKGELLYNGIRLPAAWPPRAEEVNGEPMSVPYLESPPSVIPIDVGRQLFVDDFLIEETTLKRTFHSSAYHPASPVLKPDQPWEDPNMAMVYGDGVWFDPHDQLFKMWYLSGLQTTCYATSRDGIHWEKPALDIEAGTNIVMRHQRRDSATIWLDLYDKDPGRRYKALVFSKSSPRGLLLRVSPDGIHWSEALGRSKNIGDRSSFFHNPFRDVWVYSLRVGKGKYQRPRTRVYREHRDALAGLQWNEDDGLYEQHTDLFPWVGADRLDPRHPDPKYSTIEPQLYNLDGVAYESLMLGLFTIWQGPENDVLKELGIPKRNEVLLGFSRDGFHWHRPCRRAFAAAEEKDGAWNWGNVQAAGGGCLVVGDELYFYVSGRESREPKKRCTTGLAVLRRDGFASMDAEGQGTLTTRPVRFSGRHLFVNANTQDGSLKAEVLDEEGDVIEPFGNSNCIPVSSDNTRAAVHWKGAEDLNAISGKTVRFRFHLDRGSLYAFWVSPGTSGASHGYVAAGGPGLTGPKDTVGEAEVTAPQ